MSWLKTRELEIYIKYKVEAIEQQVGRALALKRKKFKEVSLKVFLGWCLETISRLHYRENQSMDIVGRPILEAIKERKADLQRIGLECFPEYKLLQLQF